MTGSIDRAAAEMAMYLEKIQRPNGLLSRPYSPFLLGTWQWLDGCRNVRLLSVLPKDNPNRPVIMKAYKDDGYYSKIRIPMNVAPVD